MPIWEEVELFCRAIVEQGQKEAEEVLSQAKDEAQRIIAKTQRQAEKEFQEKILAQRSEVYLEAKRLVDSAELEARKRIITFREQVIQEVLSTLELRLKNIRKQLEYPDLLLSAIKEGIDFLPGKEFVVELSQKDLEFVKDKIEALGKELSLKIELEASPSVEGGSRIYTSDRRLLYDNTLLARLKRYDHEIRREIWRKIFGTGESKRS